MKKVLVYLFLVLLILFNFSISYAQEEDTPANESVTTDSTNANTQNSIKMAVTTKGYDDMGAVLKTMELEYKEISIADLADYNKIKDYDIIFINCSDDADRAEEDVAEGIKKFVESGKYIYASDWAYNIINQAFPGKIVGKQIGRVGTGTYQAKITDRGLASYSGKENIEIGFEGSSWLVIESIASDVYIYIEGQANVDKQDISNTETSSQNYEAKDKVPYTVSFDEGKGTVFFTSFHNEDQTNQDVRSMLYWFVFKPRSKVLTDQNKKLLTSSGFNFGDDLIDIIGQDNTKTYQIDKGDKDLVFSFNFNQGEYKVAVNQKDEKIFEETLKSDSNPKVIKAKKITLNSSINSLGKLKSSLIPQVKAAEEEKLVLKVTGVKIPQKNDPYVITLAQPAKFMVQEISTETLPTVVTAPKIAEKTYMQKIKDEWRKFILYPILGLIFIIILITGLIKILKKDGNKFESGTPINTQTPSSIPSKQQSIDSNQKITTLSQSSAKVTPRTNIAGTISNQGSTPIKKPIPPRRSIGFSDIVHPRRLPSQEEKPPERK